MRRLFRWAFRGLILLLLLVVILLLSLDHLARAALERRLRFETGMEARIGSVSLGLLYPSLTIENLRLYNPPQFGGSPLIQVAELHVEYNRRELFAGRLHCQLLRCDVTELNLVANRKGQFNLGMPAPGQGAPPKARRREEIAGLVFTGIDTLNFSLGRVTALRMSDPRRLRELNPRLRNRVLTNLASEEDLMFQLGVVLLEQNGGVSLLEFLTKS